MISFHLIKLVFVFLTSQFIEFRDQENLAFYAARATEQSIDQVKNNIQWMSKNYNKVVAWLERNH